MSATGDMLRRMDYMKRARNTLGVKTALKSTKLMECSSFVRSANERHDGILQNAVRKMEADEKQFRDVHSRQLTNVRRFHNTVHTKSTSVDDISPKATLPTSASDSRLFALAQADDSTRKAGSGPEDSRRGSFPSQGRTPEDRRGSFPSQGRTPEDRRGSFPSQGIGANQSRRHSVKPDTSKSGRSFRKLRDVIAPGSKAKICPEPVLSKSASTSMLDSVRSSAGVLLVSESKR